MDLLQRGYKYAFNTMKLDILTLESTGTDWCL